MFERLFSELSIGPVVLPNRIAFMAHRTNLAERGVLGDRLAAYYERRAEGGPGLVVVGEWSIHTHDRPWEGMMNLPGNMDAAGRLVERIHRKGAKVFSRLTHHGFQGSGAISRLPVWGPSAVEDIAFGETAKAMEAEDVEAVVCAFSRAASRVSEAGFDGIEVDMGPESLLRQFLSPISNHRQDDYGGSLENRARFPLEVLKGIRAAVGGKVAVGVRLCVDEQFWGGIAPEESAIMAKAFQDDGGAEFFHAAVGTYYNLYLQSPSMHVPTGFAREAARGLKEAVGVPVFAAQHIDFPDMAEDMLQKGEADGIGLVRPLICDPDGPKKAEQGRTDEIRPCLRDNQGCVGRVNRSRTLSCTWNPGVGFEGKPRVLERPPSRSGKKVLVVGAGPGGVEAAVAARLKGHSVTLYEKSTSVGGQVSLMALQPGRKTMERAVRYWRQTIERLRIQLITGTEATAERILEEAPDAVIVATGSRPIRKPLPGVYAPPGVQTVLDVLEGRFPIGERVLFVDEDGGHHAAATVEFLLDIGKRVTMVTSLAFIGMDLATIGDLYLTRQRLLQKGAVFVQDVSVEEIRENRVSARRVFTREPVVFDDFDTLVLDMGREADDGLYFELKGRVEECVRVGDCVAPRGMGMAVFEGRRAGERL